MKKTSKTALVNPEIIADYGTYINPLSDFGFKKLFGQNDSKEFLISFLNSLLKRYNAPEISDLTYRNTEMLGSLAIDRKVIFDLYCTTKNGANFVVELQKAEQEFYQNRSLCYGCRAITEQMKKGKNYKYELSKVFVVSILNFVMPENRRKKDGKEAKYIYSSTLRNDEAPHEITLDKLQFISLELPNFNKKITEKSETMDKWLHIFKNMAMLTEESQNNSAYIDEFWTKFFVRAQIKNLKTREFNEYQSSLTLLNEIQEVKEVKYRHLEREKKEETEKRIKAEEERNKVEEEMKELTEQLKQTEIKAVEEKEKLAEQLKQSDVNGIKRLLKFNVPIEEIMKEYPDFTESEILALKN